MIIGITGKKRSGKDEVGIYLYNEHRFIRYALADPMKWAVQDIFLMTKRQLWGDRKEIVDNRYGVTPRQLLQVVGTELFQYAIYRYLPDLKISPRKLWINRFRLWYKKTTKKNGFEGDVCITDVRFPHEAETIKEMGGIIIKLERPSLDYEKDNHASEQEIDLIQQHWTVINDGTIEDLYPKIDEIIKSERHIKELEKNHDFVLSHRLNDGVL